MKEEGGPTDEWERPQMTARAESVRLVYLAFGSVRALDFRIDNLCDCSRRWEEIHGKGAPCP